MSKKIFVIFIICLVVVVAIMFYIFSLNKINSKNKIINFVDGLRVEILREGSGIKVKNGDIVIVNYIGMLEDGTVFDSSYNRNKPFMFKLGSGMVIKGWEEGIVGMKVGEKRKLTIPPNLGYGVAGIPGGPIPPNSTLVFKVELLKIN